MHYYYIYIYIKLIQTTFNTKRSFGYKCPGTCIITTGIYNHIEKPSLSKDKEGFLFQTNSFIKASIPFYSTWILELILSDFFTFLG